MAYHDDDGAGEKERQRLGKLVGLARKQSKVEGVFGRRWWVHDGIWTYEIVGQPDSQEVGDQHPVVRSLEKRVGEEIERASV